VHGQQTSLATESLVQESYQSNEESMINNASHDSSKRKNSNGYETTESGSLWTHRQSLPTNALEDGSNPADGDRQKSVTPEITITEDELLNQQEPGISSRDSEVQPSSTKIVMKTTSTLEASAFSRLSRSTEDVHKGSTNKREKPIGGKNLFGVLSPGSTRKGIMGFTFNNLTTGQSDVRCSSEEDIFGSLLHMKGSHSENALRDNSSQSPQKLFAPFGKIAKGVQNIGANYLDPRKLRESLRQPRNELYKREVDDDFEERKKHCVTKILDL